MTLQHASLIAGFVPVILDKPRNLLIDLNALAFIEETSGRSILTPKDWQKPTTKSICQMIHAFVRHEDPEVKFETIARGVNFQDMPKLTDAIAKAWKLNVSGTPADGDQKDGRFPEAEIQGQDPLPSSTGPLSGALELVTSD